ncbi:hypothetical protein CYLTODRAFT_362195, partial [Cylindrobasidium torrendii FP15055 ss-10]
SSTHNVRIERLWVDVGIYFVRYWRAFFQKLERCHRLDPSKPEHLWLLHLLFHTEINKDCEGFVNMWNHHPISGQGRDQTPVDLNFAGRHTHGEYTDEYENCHPDLLQRYLGVAGRRRARRLDGLGGGATGGADGEYEEVQEFIAADQAENVRNPQVDPPPKGCPFGDNGTFETFQTVLADVVGAGRLPEGFGILENKWDDGGYGVTEPIKMRGGKTADIALPLELWYPRAALWCAALYIMTDIMEEAAL